MAEIPAARPIDPVRDAPALARQRLERSPNLRLGLGTHSTAPGQVQRATTQETEHDRHEAAARVGRHFTGAASELDALLGEPADLQIGPPD